jgi:hypothetical protein
MLEYRPLSTSERANASCWSVSEIDDLTLIGLSPLSQICYPGQVDFINEVLLNKRSGVCRSCLRYRTLRRLPHEIARVAAPGRLTFRGND